jgi:hypothetical protein
MASLLHWAMQRAKNSRKLGVADTTGGVLFGESWVHSVEECRDGGREVDV